MTEGEKMVWAAVFARDMGRLNVITNSNVVRIIRTAGETVKFLRSVRGDVKDEYGEDSDIFEFHHEMITLMPEWWGGKRKLEGG